MLTKALVDHIRGNGWCVMKVNMNVDKLPFKNIQWPIKKGIIILSASVMACLPVQTDTTSH